MSRRDLFLHKSVEGRILFRQDNAEAGDAFQDAIYHLCGRGNARQRIFQDEWDRARFVQLLAESARRLDGTVLCFVLMSNHFHLLAQTHRANLGRWMHWLLVSYAVLLTEGIAPALIFF